MTEQPLPREGQRPEPIPAQATGPPPGDATPPAAPSPGSAAPPADPSPGSAAPPADPSPVSAAAPRDPVPPAASEATRLLCVGAHYDRDFREAVLDELYVHEERFPAPSVGIDAGRVLSHAARARHQEVAWAGGILGLWALGLLVSGWLVLPALFFSLLLLLARWVRGSGPVTSSVVLVRRVLALWLRWYARLGFAFLAVALLGALLFGSGSSRDYSADDSVFDSLDPEDDGGFDVLNFLGALLRFDFEPSRLRSLLTLAVLAGIVACVALRRGQFARTVSEELSPTRFPHTPGDPAETSASARVVRLRARLRAEQHQPLVMYEEDEPFRGFGTPFRTWSLAIELRPRGEAAPVPLDNGRILRRIVPLVEALRVPSPREDPALAGAVIDRLRELRLDECVFLPADGLERRDAAPYEPHAFEAHRAAALEEGGEARRHFLRIRVGGFFLGTRRHRLRPRAHAGRDAHGRVRAARPDARTPRVPARRARGAPSPRRLLARARRLGARPHPGLARPVAAHARRPGLVRPPARPRGLGGRPGRGPLGRGTGTRHRRDPLALPGDGPGALSPDDPGPRGGRGAHGAARGGLGHRRVRPEDRARRERRRVHRLRQQQRHRHRRPQHDQPRRERPGGQEEM
ncbi:LOW QUALITY PROTEIN: conserved hypothetical protein, partial [Streptomyces sp. SPB074]